MDKSIIENFFGGNYLVFYTRFLPKLHKVTGDRMMAICPFHEDSNPSLSINIKTGFFNCFGCDAQGDIYTYYAKMKCMSLPGDFPTVLTGIAEDFGISNSNGQAMKQTVMARYDYQDSDENLIYQIERLEPGKNGKKKDFRVRRPDGNGGWVYDAKGVKITPYHLQEVMKSNGIIIVEGEKDVDNLISLGFTATTNPFGAEKWPEHFGPYFTGKDIVLIPDNDDPGRQHMDKVAANLKGHAASIKYLELPDLPEKGDISDFIAKSGSKEDVTEQLAIMIDGATLYEPPAININADNGHRADANIKRDESCGEVTTNYIGAQTNIPSLAWPDHLDEASYHGVIGDWVKRVEPHTEADSAALLFQGLVIFGNMVGPNPYFMVEATEHRCNENLLLVGNTSKGRKGTSWDHARRIGKLIDPSWESECIKSGLTSGEGLIYHVRDPQEKKEKTPADEGVADKRLVAYESEFASVLKIIERKDNTLSAIMRDAWDYGHLRTLAKNSPVKATGAHISIVSHVTKTELMMRLSTTESFNGFANRFLFVCVKRSKLLPEGGGSVDISGILPRFHKAWEFSKKVREMRRDEVARDIWRNVYGELTKEQPGILGSVLARDAAHVVRLSMIYALLDCSAMIKREHLMAALACWEYVEASAKYIFESMTGDPVADKIYEATWAAGTAGISRTDINNKLFKRNVVSERIDQAVKYLLATGRIKDCSIRTGGRLEQRIWARL